jgi:predicted nucleic acid-binding protein
MPSKPPAVYWDACCFIGRIQRESDKIADLEQLTTLAEDGKLLIVTSTLTIAEVLYEPGNEGPDGKKIRLISTYFEHPWIVLRALDRRTAEMAADVRVVHKLKIADAIHVATALRWKVKFLHTYDNDHLLKKNGMIGVPPLEIIKPRYPEDHPLFDSIQEGTPPVLKLITEDAEGETAGPNTTEPAIGEGK